MAEDQAGGGGSVDGENLGVGGGWVLGSLRSVRLRNEMSVVETRSRPEP